MNQIHRSSVGTFHPAPGSEVAWTVNDTRGYMDTGPSCSECGDCACEKCHCGTPEPLCQCHAHLSFHQMCNHEVCIGLSFAYVCLDGGESLCQACFEKEGDVEVIACDC